MWASPLTNGNFVVAWTVANTPTWGYSTIYAQIIYANCTMSQLIQVTPTLSWWQQSMVQLVVNPTTGQFWILWDGGYNNICAWGMSASLFDENGNLMKYSCFEQEACGTRPVLIGLSNGNLVLTLSSSCGEPWYNTLTVST